jgi:hypothetical protein
MKAIYEAADQLMLELKNAGFNTVTFGNLNDIDLDKQSLYPLAHITLGEVNVRGGVAIAQYNLAAMDVVDDSRIESAIGSYDNTLDIANDLSEKVNQVWQRYQRNRSLFRVNEENLRLEFFFVRYENKLAGYEGTFNVISDNQNKESC